MKLALAAFALFAFFASQQTPPPASADAEKKDEGIPVTSPLVRQRCGSCHRADEQGRMTRISYRRTTPEGWEETIKRMVSLNDVKLDPSDAREIVRYLADHHGLAPEEVAPGAFEVERRLVDYKYDKDKDAEETCIKCHSFGRVLLQRRTKEEWELLLAMHRGYYPLVDFQAFRRGGPPPRDQQPGPDGRPPDNRHPMEKALEHLSKTYPLDTPTWSAWSASMQPAKLAGRWAVSGYQAGKGAIVGQVVVSADPNAPDSFNIDTRYTLARTGETVTRAGKAIVYTGFQWRGRGGLPGSDNVWREVMLVERDWKEMSGRWFTGAYDETGIDVKLVRLTSDPVVFGSDLTALKTATTGRALKIYGANLPASVKPEDIGFGQGVKVTRVVSAGRGSPVRDT